MTGRYRIACISPWPPMRSGVADYCATITPKLAQHFDVEVFAPGEPDGTAYRFPVRHLSDFEAHDRSRPFDLRLFHLGNDVRLAGVYRLALERPGVVVLHDPVLHPLVSELTWGRDDRPAFWREVSYGHGASAATKLVEARVNGGALSLHDYPLGARIVDTSHLVLVHSDYAARLLRRESPNALIRTIPLASFGDQHVSRPDARARLGFGSDEFLVGSFGFVTAEKRYHVVLPAFRQLRAESPTARLIIVGQETATCPIDLLISRRRMERIAQATGWVDEEQLLLYMDAVDLSVHLRYPTMGETSASAIRCLSAGHPIIVSDAGWFAELPEDVAVRIPVDLGEEERLADALVQLAKRQDARDRMAAAAREYVEREHNGERVIAELRTALVEVIERRPCPMRSSPPIDDVSTVSRVHAAIFAAEEGSGERRATHVSSRAPVTPPASDDVSDERIRGEE